MTVSHLTVAACAAVLIDKLSEAFIRPAVWNYAIRSVYVPSLIHKSNHEFMAMLKKS